MELCVSVFPQSIKNYWTDQAEIWHTGSLTF